MKRIEAQPSRAELAYQAILDGICDGTLAPGTHLIQEQLASRLGVSRQPIQQAMALLKNDGIVQEIGARGLFVAPLDISAMQQHYQIRGALDEVAARLAAGNAKNSPDVREGIRHRGAAIVEAGLAAASAGDVRRMVLHDAEFHKFIYDVSGNPLLTSAAEPHWRYLRRVMVEVVRYAGAGESVWRQHRGILEAIVGGEEDAAAQAAGRHVARAAERLAAAFENRDIAGGAGAGVTRSPSRPSSGPLGEASA